MSVSVAVITVARGPHVTNYLNTLSLMDRVGKVHVCDFSGEVFGFANETLGAKLSGTSTEVATCLAKGPYTFVLVALDNRISPGVIRQALEAGFPVFSEKTGARTAAEWKPIADFAARRKLLVGMSYPNRYRPSVQEARRLIEAGMLGKLYGFYVQTIATQARLRGPKGNWMFDRETSGGGYLIWLGCHYLDLLRYVAGREVTEIGAISERVSDLVFDVEDAIALALKLEGGAVGAANFGYYLGPDSRFGGKQSQLIFWGERGWIRLQPGDDEDVPVEVYSDHPAFLGVPYRKTSFVHQNVPRAYGSGWGLAFLNDFLSACLGECAPPVTARDAEAVLEIIDAAYLAAKERRVVEVASSHRVR